MEPRTNGKVILNTTYGPLNIELWGKECPLACKNFIQLCLEGYYDGSSFHRLVPGFCLQGGKPTDTKSKAYDCYGSGSAIYEGGRFKIETHSRLKFGRRGLLGMVAHNDINGKKLDVNGTEFFFTLSETPELNGVATLFGRISDDTIYNLLRMGDLEINPKTEEPLYAPVIINTKIELNPFEYIVLRNQLVLETEFSSEQGSKFKNVTINDISDKTLMHQLKKKNTSLLSFAVDDEISAEENLKMTCVSNNITDKSSADIATSLSSSNSTADVVIPVSSSLQFLQQMKLVQMRENQNKIDQIEKIEEELGFRSHRKTQQEPYIIKSSAKTQKLSALERHRAKFEESKKRKNTVEQNQKKDNEIDTILLLNSFRKKIKENDDFTIKSEENEKNDKNNLFLDICKLHGLVNCLSCRNNFNINLTANPSDTDDKGWLMHKLVFDRKELDGKIREDLRELVIIDPREAAHGNLKISIKKKNNEPSKSKQ